jgi:hypothetical protein
VWSGSGASRRFPSLRCRLIRGTLAQRCSYRGHLGVLPSLVQVGSFTRLGEVLAQLCCMFLDMRAVLCLQDSGDTLVEAQATWRKELFIDGLPEQRVSEAEAHVSSKRYVVAHPYAERLLQGLQQHFFVEIGQLLRRLETEFATNHRRRG